MSVGFMCCCHYILFGSRTLHSYGSRQMVSLTRTLGLFTADVHATNEKFWACLCTEAWCQPCTGVKAEQYACLCPSAPPRAILAVVVVTLCVWIHSRVSRGGHFPQVFCLIWYVETQTPCQWHLPSHGWFPQERRASSPFKPSRPGLAFCAN